MIGKKVNLKMRTTMSKRKCVVFDIDGTLANIDHRVHYVESKPANWKAFADNVYYDTPVEYVIELLEFYEKIKKYAIVVLTGREGTEKQQDDTVKWLYDNDIEPDLFIMRPEGNYDCDTIIKKNMMVEVEKNYEVHCIFDDRPKVVRMWRDAGYYTFCVNQRNSEF